MPRCKKCLLDLPPDSFYTAANTKSGLQGSCKSCFISRNIAYAKSNRDSVNSYHRGWANSHKESEKHRVATWQRLNKVKCSARKRRWRLAHPEKLTSNIVRKLLSHKLRPVVFARDSYRCLLCSSVASLQLHHILPVSKYPHYSEHLQNMATLCFNCHLHHAHGGRWSELNIEIAHGLLLKVFANTPIHSM